MRWRYWIQWMNGDQEEYESTRFKHASEADRNLVIYINEHGHDSRFDEVIIPLANVKRYTIKEIW